MASTAARIAKDKGNAAFKAGNWADAVGHYSAAVLADRAEPTYPLNRAAAYLKLAKHRDAERDCTTVLSLDGKNVKALFRRAQARVALGSLTEAEADLTSALRLEPANDSVKTELTAVQKRKSEAAKKQGSNKREPITVSPLASSSQPNTKPAPKTATPPRRITRNVPIEIIEPEDPLLAPESKPVSSTDFLNPIQSRVLTPSAAPPSPDPAPSPTHVSKPTPRVGAAIFRADGNHTILRAPTSEATASPATKSPPATPSPPAPASAVPPAATPLSNAATSPKTATPAPAPAAKSPFPATQPPLTLFAFTRAWHALPTAQGRYDLLCRVPPESLPALFQNSLEPELLVSILRTFEAVASPSTNPIISSYMSAFPAVPRFSTVLLFLSAKEKDVVKGACDKVGGEGRVVWGV